MKKIFVTLLTAAACITTAHAQIGFAPEAGLNLASQRWRDDGDKVDDFRWRPGLRVGAVVDLQVVEGLSLQPGLFYSQKGTNYRHTNTAAGVRTTTELKSRISYLEIPINLTYSFGEYSDGFFVFAGPYIGYALDGRSKTITTVGSISRETTEDIRFGDDRGDLKRVDVGGNIGLGYMLPVGLYFRAQYTHGFTNLLEGGSSDNSIRNSCFALSLGFMIGER